MNKTNRFDFKNLFPSIKVEDLKIIQEIIEVTNISDEKKKDIKQLPD